MAPGASQVPVQVVLLGTLVLATQRSPAFSFSLALPQGERRLARGQQSFRGLFPGGGLGSSRFISSLGRTQCSLSQRPSPESSPAVLLLSSLGLRALRRRPGSSTALPGEASGPFPAGERPPRRAPHSLRAVRSTVRRFPAPGNTGAWFSYSQTNPEILKTQFTFMFKNGQ